MPCYIENQLRGRAYVPEPCDIHHTNGGNDHMATYGNCPWHHRGVPKNDMRPSDMVHIFGPSLAISPRGYRIRYGSESELLALQDALLLKSLAALQEGQKHGTRTRQDDQTHRFS